MATRTMRWACLFFVAVLAGGAARIALADDLPDAPSFRKTALDGQVFDTGELKGKVVVLNLWFIACPPCVAEIPELNRLAEEFKDVTFLGLALDSKDDLEKFLKDTPFRYHIIPDAGDVVLSSFRSGDGPGFSVAFPLHVVIDKTGKVVFKGGSKTVGDLKTAIEKAVK